ITEADLVTLCRWCHSKRHHVLPHEVYERDGYSCTECGTKATVLRFADEVLDLHCLKAPCWGAQEHTNDPADFITLCRKCHHLKHPDKVVYAAEAGYSLRLPMMVMSNLAEFGITLPVTSEVQLAPYKDFIQIVHYFFGLFRKQGVPKK